MKSTNELHFISLNLQLTFKGAVVVSILVTTYLLVKSRIDVNRKNEATPIDATTIRIHMYLPLPWGTPLDKWGVSVKCCQPCKLVDRQKSVKASLALSHWDLLKIRSFDSFRTTAILLGLPVPFITMLVFECSSRHCLQRLFEFLHSINT